MYIKIDNYVITSHEHGFVLNTVKVLGKDSKNPGESYLKVIGCYPKLSQLITALIMRCVRQSDIESLQDMQQHIIRVSLACEKALKDFTAETAHDGVA